MKNAQKRLVRIPFRYKRSRGPGWIPVKSGCVPVDDSPVLVCTEHGFISVGMFSDGHYFVEGDGTPKGWGFFTEYEGCYGDEYERVVAWSYLPLAYKESEE